MGEDAGASWIDDSQPEACDGVVSDDAGASFDATSAYNGTVIKLWLVVATALLEVNHDTFAAHFDLLDFNAKDEYQRQKAHCRDYHNRERVTRHGD